MTNAMQINVKTISRQIEDNLLSCLNQISLSPGCLIALNLSNESLNQIQKNYPKTKVLNYSFDAFEKQSQSSYTADLIIANLVVINDLDFNQLLVNIKAMLALRGILIIAALDHHEKYLVAANKLNGNGVKTLLDNQDLEAILDGIHMFHYRQYVSIEIDKNTHIGLTIVTAVNAKELEPLMRLTRLKKNNEEQKIDVNVNREITETENVEHKKREHADQKEAESLELSEADGIENEQHDKNEADVSDLNGELNKDELSETSEVSDEAPELHAELTDQEINEKSDHDADNEKIDDYEEEVAQEPHEGLDVTENESKESSEDMNDMELTDNMGDENDYNVEHSNDNQEHEIQEMIDNNSDNEENRNELHDEENENETHKDQDEEAEEAEEAEDSNTDKDNDEKNEGHAEHENLSMIDRDREFVNGHNFGENDSRLESELQDKDVNDIHKLDLLVRNINQHGQLLEKHAHELMYHYSSSKSMIEQLESAELNAKDRDAIQAGLQAHLSKHIQLLSAYKSAYNQHKQLVSDFLKVHENVLENTPGLTRYHQFISDCLQRVSFHDENIRKSEALTGPKLI